ncbi:MAG: zinc-binding dehydrogenase [Anaerolineae bacterium]
MNKTMQALVVRAPMEYEIEEVPVPECPERGLLIKVIACGLCGSDLRTLKSGHRNVTFPWTIGHEVSGAVVAAGPGYNGPWKEGDILAVAPLVFCGLCKFCIAGKFEFCENVRELAQHWPGGFAEYMAIPEEALTLGTIQAVPEGLDPVVAAVSEPICSCLNAQEKGRVSLGDTVVIIGAGPVGCIHASLARARGAFKIIVADIMATRLELAEAFGPDLVIDASRKDLVQEVRQATDGQGADVVITANPDPAAQVQAVEMAKKGGRVLLFGGLPHGNSRPGIDTNIVHYRGLSLIGTTIFARRHHSQALGLLASGRIPGEKLVTHRLPLSKFKEGVDLATGGKALKVVFLPQG